MDTTDILSNFREMLRLRRQISVQLWGFATAPQACTGCSGPSSAGVSSRNKSPGRFRASNTFNSESLNEAAISLTLDVTFGVLSGEHNSLRITSKVVWMLLFCCLSAHFSDKWYREQELVDREKWSFTLCFLATSRFVISGKMEEREFTAVEALEKEFTFSIVCEAYSVIFSICLKSSKNQATKEECDESRWRSISSDVLPLSTGEIKAMEVSDTSPLILFSKGLELRSKSFFRDGSPANVVNASHPKYDSITLKIFPNLLYIPCFRIGR